MPKLTIFLSGSVKKGETDTRPDEYFWSTEQEVLIRDSFPGVEVLILNPNTVTLPKYLVKERFEADISMLKQSDAVLLDARTKKGLGVGAEMVIAKEANIPVLALCPKGGEYRGIMLDGEGEEREWIHPFVAQFSTEVFDDLPTLLRWISEKIVPTL